MEEALGRQVVPPEMALGAGFFPLLGVVMMGILGIGSYSLSLAIGTTPAATTRM